MDFHGHSRKKNIFMYGCSNRMKTKAASTDDDPLNESDNELDNELYSGSDVVKVIRTHFATEHVIKFIRNSK